MGTWGITTHFASSEEHTFFYNPISEGHALSLAYMGSVFRFSKECHQDVGQAFSHGAQSVLSGVGTVALSPYL